MTLFLFVAKVAWLALRPSNLLWLAALFALVLVWRERRRAKGGESRQAGRKLLLALALAYVVLASPLGHMPLWALENRFVPCNLDRIDADVVAVLGGAVKTNLSNQVGAITVGDSGERLMTTAALAQRPDAPLILASGGVFVLSGQRNEAQWIEAWLKQIGVPDGRVAFEGTSLNTYQNAREIKAMLPRSAQRLALVTSAFHMPRAVGVFRAAGFDVQACAVDYRVNLLQVWGYPDASMALRNLDLALHELVGALAYGLTGRSQGWLASEARAL